MKSWVISLIAYGTAELSLYWSIHRVWTIELKKKYVFLFFAVREWIDYSHTTHFIGEWKKIGSFFESELHYVLNY